jgi:ankyrin repeat protein
MTWIDRHLLRSARGRMYSTRTHRQRLRVSAVLLMAAFVQHLLAACADQATADLDAAKPAISLPQGKDGKMMAEAAGGDIFSVDQLLKDGADANTRASNGTTALMGAAYGGYPRTAELLLARGAQVNARSNDGATALHYAASGGDADVVRILLRAGADPNAKTADGASPAAWAERTGHGSLVPLLQGRIGA